MQHYTNTKFCSCECTYVVNHNKYYIETYLNYAQRSLVDRATFGINKYHSGESQVLKQQESGTIKVVL